jgi:hypothetical protein
MKHLIFLICITAAACNNSAKITEEKNDSLEQDSTDMQDMLPAVEDSVVSYQALPNPEGIYQAALPCGDCKSLQHTIAFYPDKTFRLEEEKQGVQNSLIKTTGTWTSSNDIISIYKDQLLVGQYRWNFHTISHIQKEKEYPLGKLAFAGENEVWSKKKYEGIEFFGVGNEPFWNIEIDEQKEILFQLADWSKPLPFKPTKPLLAGDSTIYKTSNDSGQLHVVVYNQFCSDGMSDFIYNNKVKVTYRNKTFNGCGLSYK